MFALGLFVFCLCYGDKPVSQVSIDTTYNCSPFFVTAMTFAHPMFHYYSSHSTCTSILVTMNTSSEREVMDYNILPMQPLSKKKELILLHMEQMVKWHWRRLLRRCFHKIAKIFICAAAAALAAFSKI